jgi:methylated-DNA-[protein]-cysteine S-methyltransferase
MLQKAIQSGKLTPDMNFNEKVWALTSRIPKGEIVTYADIAKALNTKGYRAVGNALNRNPYAPKVPCHRVVGSSGALTGFAGGVDKKKQILLAEGVKFVGMDRVDVSRRFRLR